MDEEAQCDLSKKRAKQPPSVPFHWEERPGIPRKGWCPGNSSSRPPPSLPTKLVASVPFMWEEEPGKPLASFSTSTQPPTSPSPNHGKSVSMLETTCKLNKDPFGNESEESFSSPRCLSEFSIASATTSSNVTPINSSSPYDHSSPLFGPPSSDAVISRTSLEDPSFLEYLFPLYAPDSGFLGEVRSSNVQHRGSSYDDCEIVGDNRVKHSKTLQDLIMTSQRRSIVMKAAGTGIENPPLVNSQPTTCNWTSEKESHDYLHRERIHHSASLEINKDCARRNAIWCCIFGISGKMTS